MTLMTQVLEHGEAAPSPRRAPTGGQRRSRRRRWWLVGAVAAIAAALLAVGSGSQPLLRPEGAGLLGDFFAAAVRPELSGDFLLLTADAALTTLAYAALGTALSLVIGLVFGVLMSQTWWMSGARSRGRRGVAGWVFTRIALVVPRGIHEVVWGLFFLILFGIDPLAAVLAIGIPFGAVTAKVFSELLDETSRKPYEALLAAGVGKRSAIIYGLLPPAMSDLLSYGFYRFECAIRSAAVLGLIGAGGLGFELKLSFDALLYSELWTLLYALILLSAAADYWSAVVRSRRVRRPDGYRRDPVLTGSLVAGVGLVVFGAWWVGLDLGTLVSDRTATETSRLLADLWPPEIGEGGIARLLELSGVTLAMSVLAMVVAFVVGAALAFPAANLSRLGQLPRSRARGVTHGVMVAAARLVLIVLRAVPPPVWALLLLFVLYPGILPGAVALGVYTAGVLGRLMAEAAENLDGRPLRALRAQGATETQVFCYGIVPAATPRFMAYGLYRWEVTIRETVVVGVVGAGGLGLALDHQIGSFAYGEALTTLIVLIGLTLIVDLASAALRRSLR